ncbi:MAG: hypothetical protein ACOCG4_06435 [Methanoculleus sp.]
MKSGAEERRAGEPGPVTFTCYRITPGEEKEEGVPGEGMSSYSVVVLLPGGEFRHQVVWAGAPEDVGDAIRVPPGSRVIMTEMADALIWDSGPVEIEEVAPEAAPAS